MKTDSSTSGVLRSGAMAAAASEMVVEGAVVAAAGACFGVGLGEGVYYVHAMRL